MNEVTATRILRPGPTGVKRLIQQTIMAALPALLCILRRLWPIPHFGTYYAVTRYDDVREVFATDPAFGVPYKPKLDIILGDKPPFFLGMGDTPQYRSDTAAMRRVVRMSDLPSLAGKVEAMAQSVVASAGGQLEVVDGLVRKVTFRFVQEYLGIPDVPNADLRMWCTRLFEYQFIRSDAPLVAEVKQLAPALRAHIQGELGRRRTERVQKDDVLGRCLALQDDKAPGYSDDQIRTAIMGFLVGGPPQPPMVVPQALEQLLRRPEALRAAQVAARNDDDALLAGFVFEAMRFDPLAPGMPRVSLRDWTIARGTSRQTSVPAGAQVFAAFASAMMDGRRIPDPSRFNPARLEHEYMHFGYGLHQCFGLHINRATLPMMLKPLLLRPNLRRAKGSAGHLRKNGPFAESLFVEYG